MRKKRVILFVNALGLALLRLRLAGERRVVDDAVAARLEHAQVGAVLDGPHVHTVDEALRTKWASHFPLDDAVFTSAPAARAHGFDERPLPPSLLLNLCLCLSVEPFSHSCRLHLGLRDARQIAPVAIGDTVRVQVRIEQLRNTSSGDAAVIVTTHLLVNQRDEPVFVLTKDSYYDPIPGLEARAALPQSRASVAAASRRRQR